MLDLDLLRSFVSVVDSGGFTRAGERVHRTQSTISQQIRRLEEAVGRPLFHREGRAVRLTEDGERLIGYARRLLSLAAEARAAVGGEPRVEVVRLGVPDDFAVEPLTEAVAAFSRARPGCRLSVRCALSIDLVAGLEADDYDVVLAKRDPGAGPALARWPERLVWIASAEHPLPADPLPLIAFPHGCVYRSRAVHALERSGRDWRIAYESPNLMGIQVAIAGGLGVALLEERAVRAGHRVLGSRDGLPDVPPTELALMVRKGAGAAAADLAEELVRFCAATVPKAA
jgi:DNA-binding transcriptional LysR family regulator